VADRREPPSAQNATIGLSVWLVGQRCAAAQRRGKFVAGSGAHPARMWPDLAATAIDRFTRPGDLVLDPLAGVGTTLIEAVRTGRDAIGVEYEQRWTRLAAANLRLAAEQGATGHGMVVHGDATRLPDLLPPVLRGRVALVLTSPPYGRTMHGRVEHRRGPLRTFANSYGPRDPANLAHHGLPGITAAMTAVLTSCLPLLRPCSPHPHAAAGRTDCEDLVIPRPALQYPLAVGQQTP
jgi:modification methylase